MELYPQLGLALASLHAIDSRFAFPKPFEYEGWQYYIITRTTDKVNFFVAWDEYNFEYRVWRSDHELWDLSLTWTENCEHIEGEILDDLRLLVASLTD